MKQLINLRYLAGCLWLAPVLGLAESQTAHLTVTTKDGQVIARDATYAGQHGSNLVFVVAGQFVKPRAADLRSDLLKQLGLSLAMVEKQAVDLEIQRVEHEKAKVIQRERYGQWKARLLELGMRHAMTMRAQAPIGEIAMAPVAPLIPQVSATGPILWHQVRNEAMTRSVPSTRLAGALPVMSRPALVTGGGISGAKPIQYPSNLNRNNHNGSHLAPNRTPAIQGAPARQLPPPSGPPPAPRKSPWSPRGAKPVRR